MVHHLCTRLHIHLQQLSCFSSNIPLRFRAVTELVLRMGWDSTHEPNSDPVLYLALLGPGAALAVGSYLVSPREGIPFRLWFGCLMGMAGKNRGPEARATGENPLGTSPERRKCDANSSWPRARGGSGFWSSKVSITQDYQHHLLLF